GKSRGIVKLDQSRISNPKSEVLNWTGTLRDSVQFAISDFGFEILDSSNFKISLLLCLLLLSACTVGPKYKRPAGPTPPAFKEPTPAEFEEEGWTEAHPQDEVLRGSWWEMFQDPSLSLLEEQVNVSNLNVAAAEAQFRAARAG